MPVALDVPWDEIRTKLLSGVPYATIADTYGIDADTVRRRANRHGWKPTAIIATQAAKKAVNAHVASAIAAVQPALDSAVKEWVDRSKHAAQLIVGKVTEAVPVTKEPEDLQRLAGALDRADTVGRRALGLDREDLGPRLTNIAIGLVYAHAPQAAGGLLMDYANAAPENVLEAEVVGETRT